MLPATYHVREPWQSSPLSQGQGLWRTRDAYRVAVRLAVASASPCSTRPCSPAHHPCAALQWALTAHRA
jgi:hypothetical protein